MKNPLGYLSLWQKKRNELPVDSSPEQDWIKMRSALDKHLPAVPKGPGSHGGLGAGSFKTLYVVIVALSAAVAVYHFTKVSKPKRNHYTAVLNRPKNYATRLDSLSKINNSDSVKMPNRADKRQDNLSKQDSLLQSNTHAAGPNNTSSNGKLAGTIENANSKKTGSSVSAQQVSAAAIISTGKALAAHASSGRKNFAVSSGDYKHQGKTSNSYSTISKQVKTKNGLLKATLYGGRFAKPNGVSEKNKHNPNSNNSPVLSSGASSSGTLIANNNSADSSKKAAAAQKNKADSINKGDKAKESIKKGAADKKQTKQKEAKTANQSSSGFDFGILTGVNLSGSFTAKKQNANFYGSLPVDVYFGLFGTYTIKNKLGVNIQLKVLNPQNISGSYNHANGSKVDSNQTLKITDFRKAYFVSIPIQGVYKINDNVSIKAGPVINIPVKQLNGTTTLLPANITTDSVYYASATSQLKNTKYQQKINFGLSGGVSITYKRLFLEAAYLKGLSGYNISSGFGNYKYNAGNVQVTIGFSLKRAKKK